MLRDIRVYFLLTFGIVLALFMGGATFLLLKHVPASRPWIGLAGGLVWLLLGVLRLRDGRSARVPASWWNQWIHPILSILVGLVWVVTSLLRIGKDIGPR